MAFRKLLGKLAAVTAGALVVSSSAFAGFIGNTVHGEHLYPDTSTVNANLGNAVVVAPGTEYSFTIEGTPIEVDFSDTLINVFFFPTSLSAFGSATFNGLHFSDALNSINDIIGVDLVSSSGNSFDASLITFDANNIFLNFADVDHFPDSGITLAVDFASTSTPVPVPASLALLGLGLVGLGYNRRNKIQ